MVWSGEKEVLTLPVCLCGKVQGLLWVVATKAKRPNHLIFRSCGHNKKSHSLGHLISVVIVLPFFVMTLNH